MPCPRCGYPCQAGTAYCPSCQLQLVPGAPRPAGEDQMPDWVRTMQAGQSPRGGMPAPGGAGFSARSLMNEDALPQWLREAAAAGQPSQSPPPGYPAQGYGAGGGMGMGGGAAWGQAAGQNGAAQNAYDESNLPNWLLPPGANGSPQQQQQYDAYPTARQPAPYAAQPQSPQPPMAGYNAAVRQNAFPDIEQAGVYRPAPSGGLNGNSLLDANALPGWMRGDPTPAQGDPSAAYRDAGGMRGSSLIDGNALPEWLRNQPPSPPQPQPLPSAAPSIANWIGASTADDPMPSWLGQAYSDARVPPLQAPPPPPAPAQGPSAAGWPPSGAPQNGAGAPPLPGTLNANTLMDESALPEWLRSQSEAPAGGMNGMGAMPAPPSMAPPHSGTLADMHTVRMPQPARQAPPDPTRDAYAGEPEPRRFSASDLIDPDLLSGFIQGGAGPMPMSASPAQAPFGPPDANTVGRSRATGDWAEYEEDDDQPMRDRQHGRPPRGAPIPDNELPDWLQAPDPGPMRRGGPSSRRGDGYDSRRVPVPRDWNDDQYDASRWSESFEDQEFAGDYEDQPPPRDRRAVGRGRRARREDDGGRDQQRGGGSGRLRERRGFFGR